jgi:hypothetical protein
VGPVVGAGGGCRWWVQVVTVQWTPGVMARRGRHPFRFDDRRGYPQSASCGGRVREWPVRAVDVYVRCTPGGVCGSLSALKHELKANPSPTPSPLSACKEGFGGAWEAA